MKIALAHKRLDLNGGTERDFYRTAEGLRDLGHDVHLFCGQFRVPPPAGTLGHPVPCWRLGRTARLLSFAFVGPKVIRSHGCDVSLSFGRMVQQDVVRSGGSSHGFFLRRMEEDGGRAQRVWHRLSPYHRSVMAVEKRQFGPDGCGRIVAVSNRVREEIESAYMVREGSLAVIYNGVDVERFHPGRRDDRAAVRAQWGIPQESPLVLFVGSGFRRKGLDRLLRIWGSAGLAKVFLLVLGEDRRRRHYEGWAGSVAQNRVIFAGRREDVERYYGAADLLALPSLQEAFGNVVLEALASGLPVLVSKDVGAAEILSSELRQGIIDRPDDPLEVESKLLAMLEPSRRRLLAGEAARVGKAYSWDAHFRKLEGCLIEAADANGRARVA